MNDVQFNSMTKLLIDQAEADLDELELYESVRFLLLAATEFYEKNTIEHFLSNKIEKLSKEVFFQYIQELIEEIQWLYESILDKKIQKERMVIFLKQFLRLIIRMKPSLRGGLKNADNQISRKHCLLIIRLFEISKKIFIHEKKGVSAANCEAKIAEFYVLLNEDELAVHHFSIARRQFIKFEKYSYLAKVYYDLGRIYANNDENELAVSYLEKSISNLKPDSDHNRIALCQLELGDINFNADQYQIALQYFDSAVKNFKDSRHNNPMAHCLNRLGDIYARLR